jgi:hypothetical protein
MSSIGPITTYYAAADAPPPWWKRTRLGRRYSAWRGRRQMRGWTVLGATDAMGQTYEYVPEES